MMRSGNREMRRMLGKMGLEMNEMDGIEEVIIKTETKELFLIKPQVIEMKGKDMYNFPNNSNGYRRKTERDTII